MVCCTLDTVPCLLSFFAQPPDTLLVTTVTNLEILPATSVHFILQGNTNFNRYMVFNGRHVYKCVKDDTESLGLSQKDSHFSE